MAEKPLILLSNDDGIYAPGLQALADSIRELGEIVVVAPKSERSAVGHGITLTRPLRVTRVHREGTLFGYGISGTPADCIKMAVKALLPRRPDLAISGINPGPNAGINVIYSGTVSAAVEAAIMGIPAVAVSLDAFSDPDFTVAALVARRVAERMLAEGLPEGILLNLNVPALPADRILGLRVTRQGTVGYREVIEKRVDPRGREYYWLGGDIQFSRDNDGSDSAALEKGYISLTPLRFDLTDERGLDLLRGWGIEKDFLSC